MEYRVLVVVVIKALSILASVPLGVYHAFEEDTGAVF